MNKYPAGAVVYRGEVFLPPLAHPRGEGGVNKRPYSRNAFSRYANRKAAVSSLSLIVKKLKGNPPFYAVAYAGK